MIQGSHALPVIVAVAVPPRNAARADATTRRGPAATVGFWSGLVAFASTVAFLFVQALQLFGVVRPPWDGILIYGFSFSIVVPFIVEMLALHHFAPEDKKLWSHAALIFTKMYAVFRDRQLRRSTSDRHPDVPRGRSKRASRPHADAALSLLGLRRHWPWDWRRFLRCPSSERADCMDGSGSPFSPMHS